MAGNIFTLLGNLRFYTAVFVQELCATYKNLVDPADNPIRLARVWDFGCAQERG